MRGACTAVLGLVLGGVLLLRLRRGLRSPPPSPPPLPPPPPPLPLPSAFAAAGCHDGSPVLVGTHHKTGTVLLIHLFRDVCAALGWRCSFKNVPVPCGSPEQAVEADLQLCLLEHGVRFKLPPQPAPSSPRGSTGRFRFVHMIRDPLELVVSAYSYHLTTTERWAVQKDPFGRFNGTSYRAYLNALPLEAGLRAEVQRSAHDSIRSMQRLHGRIGGLPCALTLRLEDFEADWVATTARLWDLLGVRTPATVAALDAVARKHNVYSRNAGYSRHVSGNRTSKGRLTRPRARPRPSWHIQEPAGTSNG